MIHDRHVKAACFSEMPETCPAVDDALAYAGEKIKEQTSRFRDALMYALRRAMEAEERVEELEARVSDLQDQLRNVAT